MTPAEKYLILKVWIAPCCHITISTYFPTPHVVSQLNLIQQVALRLTSRGLTRDILAEPEGKGRLGQAGMGTYALWTHSKSFVQYVAKPSSMPATLSEGFGRRAHSQGLVCNEVTLPYIQLAPSSPHPPGFLIAALRAYSEVKRSPPPPTPK